MTKTITNSSLISTVEHNGSDLTVTFTNGRKGVYRNVPAGVVERLATADSPGKFFNREIRNTYTYARA